MNENYLYPDFNNYVQENPELQTETTKLHSKKVVRILKILVFSFTAVLVISGFAYFVVLPSTANCSVMFSGLQTLEAEELGRTLALYCGTSWLGFDTAEAAAHIASSSAVESVSVEKRFPDRVFVNIQERIPVAITFATVNSKTIPVLIDKNGVLFGSNTENIASSYPLITGFEFTSIIDGMRLDSKFYPLIQQIANIQKTNPRYFSVISEIKILPKEYDNYELAIYPIHLKTRVLIDRNLNEESLEYMMVTLDVVNNVNPDVSEVDLRYGTVSYKMNM